MRRHTEGSNPSTNYSWGHMFQGGEKPLQGFCEEFNSLWLHVRQMKRKIMEYLANTSYSINVEVKDVEKEYKVYLLNEQVVYIKGDLLEKVDSTICITRDNRIVAVFPLSSVHGVYEN